LTTTETFAMQAYALRAEDRESPLGPLPDGVRRQRARRHDRPDSIHAALYPQWKKPFPGTNSIPWIFAAKTTASGLIALLVAFTLNLDQPYWALLTVFIVSQPLQSGQVLAKSLYRIIGTVIGAGVALLFVALFIRMGRQEEARRSLAWALMIDPKEITLPPALPALEQTRWLELFKYPRLIAAGGLTGLTQTGGASLGLWGATLLVIVLNITPAHAAFLMVWVGLTGIVGRFFIAALIEPLGRRGAGTLACGMAAVLLVLQGYLWHVFIGSWSLFYILFLAQTFFSSAIYSVVGPYMSEIWPARLRSSGMGMSYGIGNLGGKVLGPAGLALIMGAGDIIKPAAPNLVMLGPAFVYFASWLVLGVIGFWVFGPEPKGRTFEEMDSALYRPAATARPAVQSAGN